MNNKLETPYNIRKYTGKNNMRKINCVQKEMESMMINWKTITLADREWIQNKFHEDSYKGCEYSFANNFIWRNSYHVQVANHYDCLIIKMETENGTLYSYPIGKENKKIVLQELIETVGKSDKGLKLKGILETQKQEIEEWFPGYFEFYYNRDDSDYIYTVEKLTSLSGKKLHGKRNHIARFKDNPNWQYETVTKENIKDCVRMNDEWCEIYECAVHKALREEQCAVNEALTHFFELQLVGGLIRREGRVVAYSIGEPLTEDTFVVHIEKAFPDIQGAYPMINQQFVLHNCQEFQYVNREEDTGDEGLRKAKNSYYPEILLDKYTACLKRKGADLER